MTKYVPTHVFLNFPVSELLYELTYTGKALRVIFKPSKAL